MDIRKEQLIWFPIQEAYEPREEPEYAQNIAGLTLDQVVELVTKRVNEDGQFSIDNDMVGENRESEPKLRVMMEFACDRKNIEQCIDYIYKEQTEGEKTVDFVCREMGNASKWAAAVKARQE